MPSRRESPVTRSAGSSPKRTPQETAARKVKRRALPSIRTLSSNGRLNACRCASPRVPATARTSPNAAPQHESARLSVSICLSSRKRPAPNAARIAISFCRVANLAKCKFERFAQTINITTPTAQASTKRAGTHAPAHMPCERRQSWVDRVPFRMLAGQLFSQHCKFGLGALEPYAGLQSSDDLHRVSAGFLGVLHGPGNKNIDGRGRSKDAREIEGCGQNAHNRNRTIIQSQFPAHHSGPN